MQRALSRFVALTAAGAILTIYPAHAVLARNHHVEVSAATAAASVARFQVEPFARGNANLFNPDGIVATKRYVYVVYQNASDTSPAPSTLVKYSRAGALLGAVNLAGRCDGLRLNPYTHKLWALVNNDGLNGTPPRQPALYVVDPRTLGITLYRFGAAQPHGGGYDDIAFIDGRAFFSASSPTLTATGVNDKPIVVEATLTHSGTIVIRAIAYGNSIGIDLTSGKRVRLNIADPDSLAVDSSRRLVVVSQGDAQIAYIAHPGLTGQTITRVASGTQLDDVAYTAGKSGTLFAADATLNIVYRIEARFAAGTTFSEAPGSSGVASFIGTLDPASGTLTPLLTARDGIVNPTALIFAATEGGDED